MKESGVSPIALSISAIATYVGYITLGLALGFSVLYSAEKCLPRAYVGTVFNLCIYSGALFAHFRFAHGTCAWRKLEYGSLGRTIWWAFIFIIVGSIAIGMTQAHWDRILAGFDDGIAFHKMNAHFSDSVHRHDFCTALLFLIDGCLIAPIAEELLFRSGLYRMLKGKFSVLAAAGISSALFSSAHLSVSAFLPLMLLGYLCCWIYEKTADIRGPIIFHAGYNFLVFFAAARAHV